MSNVRDIQTWRDQATEKLNLKSGDGGGTYDGMGPRIDALEKRMNRVEDKLDRIAETVARIEGKLDAKVDYKWALAITTAVILVILRAEILTLFSSTLPG